MRSPSSLKQEFLKKWMTGLHICGSLKKKMSLLERKKAIKLSADIAMASARNGTTCWSRALVANASKDEQDKILVQHILGTESERLMKKVSVLPLMNNKRIRSKKVLRRSYRSIRRAKKSNIAASPPNKVLAISIAKRLVRKRTLLLKSLVPGGEFMDEIALIEETLDYILSLRAQVDVMRSLANASEINNKN
ncbi:hypothetical protein SLE2022_151320 [Rubroshorea leprosula]